MADLVWRDCRTVLEYEGDGHRTSRTKFRSDVTRGGRYADGDWFPMRSHGNTPNLPQFDVHGADDRQPRGG